MLSVMYFVGIGVQEVGGGLKEMQVGDFCWVVLCVCFRGVVWVDIVCCLDGYVDGCYWTRSGDMWWGMGLVRSVPEGCGGFWIGGEG